VHYTTSCYTKSSAPEDGQNNCPKHVGLTGRINKPSLLNLVYCLYYLYQWFTVKQISDNEIYLFIKYTKSVLWRVAKRLLYIQDARCLKFKLTSGWRDISNCRCCCNDVSKCSCNLACSELLAAAEAIDPVSFILIQRRVWQNNYVWAFVRSLCIWN